MDVITLIKKPSNPCAKGKSKYILSVPHIASDVENWGIHPSKVGKTVDYTPQACGKITDRSKNVIASRVKARDEALAAGKEARPIRQVAGFDPFEVRIGVRVEKKVMGAAMTEKLVNQMLRAW